ncbi:hypothetical protein CYMTET_43554, partial [Cymbomonas tetramitiformis]
PGNDIVVLPWRGSAAEGCVVVTGLGPDVYAINATSTRAPLGSPALAWSFLLSDVCPDAGDCLITLCGFSVGETHLSGQVTFEGSNHTTWFKRIAGTILVVEAPPPPMPPPYPPPPHPHIATATSRGPSTNAPLLLLNPVTNSQFCHRQHSHHCAHGAPQRLSHFCIPAVSGLGTLHLGGSAQQQQQQQFVWAVSAGHFPPEPCWKEGGFAQVCEDVPAPGTGHRCAACPAGFTAALDAAACEDVDECQDGASGGCWKGTEEDAEAGPVCINTLGGHSCSACPAGFLGTRLAGCRMSASCADSNGGCDPLTACVDALAPGTVECGPCPAGYEGEGATACEDVDGCALQPCFAGVECQDTPAPGEGRACGSCPEGYHGDGAQCTPCEVALRMDPDMGTAMDGVMQRGAVNLLAGKFDGLRPAASCAVTLGMQFLWEVHAIGGGQVPLDTATNRRNTLTLYFPKDSLEANTSYAVYLSAALVGAPTIRASLATTFGVPRRPLVALIQGGNVSVGEGTPVMLDAGVSYDPNGGGANGLTYRWTCTRTEEGAAASTWGSACRNATGVPLRTPLATSAAVTLTLQGDAVGEGGGGAGEIYTVICEVQKGGERAEASVTVTVVRLSPGAGGYPPMPTIKLLSRVHGANMKLTARGEVSSLAPHTLSMVWSAVAEPLEEGAATAVDLEEVAMTSLTARDLVLRPGALTAGRVYLLHLSASDHFGNASATLYVVVNAPPHSGRLLTPTPTVGVAAETLFSIEAEGWEDDPQDLPLWYQLWYEVVGDVAARRLTLSLPQPLPRFSLQIPAAGLAAHGRMVTVRLGVKDALGATADSAQNVTVQPIVFETQMAKSAHVWAALEAADLEAASGADPLPAIIAVASILEGAENGAARRRGRLLSGSVPAATGEEIVAAVDDEPAQREAMMALTASAWDALPPVTDSVTRVAQVAAAVAGAPSQLNSGTRGQLRATVAALVAATRTGDAETQLDEVGAQQSLQALSGAAEGASLLANASAEVAEALDVTRAVALSRAQGLVPEEEPAEGAAAMLWYAAQCEDLLGAPSGTSQLSTLTASNSATVTLPLASLAAAVGDAARADNVLLVVGSTADPHAAGSSAAQPQGSDGQYGSSDAVADGLELTVVSEVTSISLYQAALGDEEVAVRGLEEGLTFTLPLAPHGSRSNSSAGAMAVPVACVFWDPGGAHGGEYRSQGCVTLPNPAPRGAQPYWRTLNVSALPALEAAWGLRGAANLTRGCEEEWGAVHPEYLGADAGYRKYLGEECQLADPGNLAGCWWEWRAGQFEGPGCVRAERAGCLCTHLTDFAAQDAERGDLRPPEDLSTISGGDMARLSPRDVAKSVVLVSVLSVLMGGTGVLYLVSNWAHNRVRLRLLLHLADAGCKFQDLEGLWTWSLLTEDWGSVTNALAVEADHLGGQKHGGKKWRSTVWASVLMPSRLRVRATGQDGGEEVPSEGGKGQRRPAGQKDGRLSAQKDGRLSARNSLTAQIRKAARRRSVFQNLVNTEATLTLEGDPAEDRQPAEDGQPAGSVAEEPVAGAVAGNRADEIPECHAQFEASAVRHPSGREQSAAEGVPSETQELGGDRPARSEENVVQLQTGSQAITCRMSGPFPHPVSSRQGRLDPAQLSGPRALRSMPVSSKTPKAVAIPPISTRLKKLLNKPAASPPKLRIASLASSLQIPADHKSTFGANPIPSWPVMGGGPVRHSDGPLRTKISSQIQADNRGRPARHVGGGRTHQSGAGARQEGGREGNVVGAQEGSAAGGPVLESYQRAPPNMLTAIGLNVYQLHLSVPLVHLEELALRSRQAKPVVCAERGGNAKGAVQGRDPVTQEDIGLPAGGSVVENYKVDVEGEDAVALLQKGALGCGEVSEFPKLEPEIKATALQASPLRAPRNQARRLRWKLQERRAELPVERMLGTALVHAFLGLRAMISGGNLLEQMELAMHAPWQMPAGRPFAWYVSAFKVLLSSLGPGWYRRSLMWSFVFLQRPDGGFDLSQSLATALKAGEPSGLNMIMSHDAKLLHETLPEGLQEAFESPIPSALGECRRVSVQAPVSLNDMHREESAGGSPQEVWATLLVVEQVKNFPYTWTHNPAEPDLDLRGTLEGHAEDYLQEQALIHPALVIGPGGGALAAARRSAATLAAAWLDAHDEHIRQLYEQHGRAKSQSAVEGTQKQAGWRQKARQLARKGRRRVRWIAKAHPLTAIMLVPATEPFTRSERILIQGNTFVLMLVFTVWFFYSKAVKCCTDFRAFLACPEARGDLQAACLGSSSCTALAGASAGEELPAELQAENFVCRAFPQGTMTDRVYVMLMIIGTLTPVTLTLSQLFITAARAEVPGHWDQRITKRTESVLGATMLASVQSAFVAAYALLFNFQKFNKAVALALVTLIGIFLKARPAPSALRPMEAAASEVAAPSCPQKPRPRAGTFPSEAAAPSWHFPLRSRGPELALPP